MEKKQISLPEIWGGIECTVNRLQDVYIDQVILTGHSERISDLDLFNRLGIKTLRYPILWEKVYNQKTKKYDWGWTDERLNRLRELNINPLPGLLHHGSGPDFTSLIDPDFPKYFRDYAYAVAERYPWIYYYNPINEPLTTARFSCLYGFWYPHLKNDLAFSKAVINQIMGISAAMKAIREVNPDAALIQTEDLAHISSTKTLKYQAKFENSRRWLTYDLLTGRINEHHPMWEFFIKAGIESTTLELIASETCIPQYLGVNYYLTSERYLDHRIHKYPKHSIGRNAYQSYADIEAVRVKKGGFTGLYGLLKDLYERYTLPVVITEAHLSCTREEQLRWFSEIYQTCVELNKEKIEVKAVTAWSLLGAFDWHNLVTRIEGVYEPGVFDIRAPQPRMTEMGNLICHLSHNNKYENPLINIPGWWKREDRFIYSRNREPGNSNLKSESKPEKYSRPLLIIKGKETFAALYTKHCVRRGIPFVMLDKSEINLFNKIELNSILENYNPWAVINTVDYQDIDKAEVQPDLCRMDNIVAAVNLSEICKASEIKFLSFSTDLVFNGNRKEPYIESCKVAPLNVYGFSKAAAEQQILKHNPSALIIRTSACFSLHNENNYIGSFLKKIENGTKVQVAKDIIISPTYTPDLINTSLDILIDGEKGIWHLTNRGSESWADFLMKLVETSGYDCKYIDPRFSRDLKFIAKRPRYSVLESERASLMPTFEQALNEYKILRESAALIKDKF